MYNYNWNQPNPSHHPNWNQPNPDPYRQPNWNNPNPAYHPNWQHQGYNQNGSNWHRRITMEEAMNIATQQVPGEVVRVELDTEHGIPVYEVEIVTQQGVEYEVNVDVNTGDIVDIELD